MKVIRNLGEMRDVFFDSERRAFAAQPGVRMADLYRTLYEGRFHAFMRDLLLPLAVGVLIDQCGLLRRLPSRDHRVLERRPGLG
ncbi:hypothetical protein [Streptomyces sp. RTd22]|uniref:hypothetical protein n=1 Tax=Streptomyces sp. RTd22 TaxID=1841249 RepID=UPI00131DDA44|nr:hypothetical protein [Streptomyces sp. RTd22]